MSPHWPRHLPEDFTDRAVTGNVAKEVLPFIERAIWNERVKWHAEPALDGHGFVVASFDYLGQRWEIQGYEEDGEERFMVNRLERYGLANDDGDEAVVERFEPLRPARPPEPENWGAW